MSKFFSGKGCDGSCQVLLDGVAVGRLSRNGAANLTLDARSALGSRAAASVVLEIVVEAVGRSNQGWRFDTKGLSSPNVRWNGTTMQHPSIWHGLMSKFARPFVVHSSPVVQNVFSWLISFQGSSWHAILCICGCTNQGRTILVHAVSYTYCLPCAGKMLEGWRVFPLPLDNLQALVFHANDTSAHADASAGGPTFFR